MLEIKFSEWSVPTFWAQTTFVSSRYGCIIASYAENVNPDMLSEDKKTTPLLVNTGAVTDQDCFPQTTEN